MNTSVVVSALRSRRGASFKLISLLEQGRFELAVSVPLILDYEDVLARFTSTELFTHDDVAAYLDYVCAIGHKQSIFFLWRPCLPDPKDDMILELAVAAGCEAVVTHNRRDFTGAERLNVQIHGPKDFLKILEQQQ